MTETALAEGQARTEERRKRGGRKRWVPYVMLAPTFLGLAVFNFYPICLSVLKSMYEWSGTLAPGMGGTNRFVFLNNYAALFADPVFWQVWKNAAFFIVTAVIVNFVFPYLTALLIFSLKSQRAQFAFRVLFVLPMIVPSIVVFLLWQFIYEPNIGLISNLGKAFDLPFIDVLGTPSSVKWGIRFMGFPWAGGVPLLVYMAGLSSIDASLRDAARIDGANLIKRLTRIDIPLCAGQFKMVFVLTVIGEVQDFVKIQTVTGGGPGYYSSVPGLYMYNVAFGSSKYGLACAAGMIMLLVMLLFSWIGNTVFRSEREA